MARPSKIVFVLSMLLSWNKIINQKPPSENSRNLYGPMSGQNWLHATVQPNLGDHPLPWIQHMHNEYA